jgi:sugar lactone lactonase YvrE
MAVSNGSWSGAPSSYGYQWSDCNSVGLECKAILGATNQNYTPSSSDVGHKLVAQVTATNGGGSAQAATTASPLVVGKSITQTVDSSNSVNAVSCVPSTTDCVVSDSKGNAFYATNVSTGSNATWTAWTGPGTSPSEAVACPTTSLCLMAAGEKSGYGGNLYYATSLGGAWTQAYSPSFGVDAISCTSSSFCVDGQDGSGYFRYSTNPPSTSWTLESQGSAAMKGVFCLSTSFCAIADGAGSVHVATTTTQVESSSWTETKVDGTTALNGIACTSTTSCVAVDGAGNVLNLAISSGGAATATKHNIDGTNSLTAVTCTGSTCATVDNAGNIFVSTNSGETWSEPYKVTGKLQAVACSSSTLCVTVDTTGNVTAFNPTAGGYTEGESHSPQPGTTLDYNVPLEGASAPYQMGENSTTHKPETEKWGQKEDVPVEATAVVAPDSPQGWPASSYKRATLYYMDGPGRTVNVAAPSTASEGTIATTEYNEYNDVIRTLSADNRVTALAAGEKSVEVAKLLDTESTYNGEGAKEKEVSEPGTRLIETLGPQHEVKYMEGKEQRESLARNHMEYFYDQGVPKEEPFEKEHYDLVTETSDLAQLANREEREVRTTKTSYSGQNNLGWTLRAPTSVTVDPNGLKLTTTTLYNKTTGQVIETRGSAAESTLTYASKFGSVGSEAGKLKTPWGIAVDSSGNLWVADSANNRLEKFGPEGKYLATVGEAGSEPGKLNNPEGVAIDSKGNLWVADTNNNRIEEFGPEGKYLATVGEAGSENGKLKAPAAVVFDSKGNLWVADTANNRVQEFNTEDKYVFQFGSVGSEPGKLSEPQGIAIDGEGHIWVSDTNNNRIQEFSTTGTLLKHFAMLGAGEGQLSSPAGLAFDAGGNLWVADRLNNRAEAFSPSGGYLTQIGSKGAENGQLAEPRALAFDAHGNSWVTDSANNRVQEFSKGANAQDAKMIYYSSEANTEGYTACGGHPEWSGLLCETLPAKQPELVAALPKLPVTTVVGYNIWNEPEKTEEVFGSGPSAKTRTKIETYDEAGRRASSETTSSSTEDTGLPKVSFEYNKEIGVLQKQSTTVEGKEQSIASEYNRLGQLVKYTDADGNVAKYKYAGPEGDGLLEEVTDSSNEGKSYQAYTYDETTKLMKTLVDSAAGTFTASYDAAGRLTSETYPNSMCANYGYNSVGEATSIKYVKTTNCSEPEAPVWYSQSRVPSVRGETYSQTSTLASNTYAYDTAGRLTETQETPAGEGCTTRAYAYDEAGNRASLATIKPNSKGECQSEGGTVEAHNYDEAGRMTDAEIAYDPLGNITKLPAADAEGHELISTFYADNAVASQEETEKNSTTIEQKNVYSLDPEGRVRKTVATGKVVGTTISHYDGQGEAVAWTSEEGGKWTRNIPGIGGVLCATQANGGTPVLQLHDIRGDIVATAALSPSETKVLSTYNSTEFGVPNEKEPPKFAWLGAGDVSKSLASGVITYGATSYVPQTGRALQSEQVEPPGLPEGSGAGAPYTSQEEPWNMQGAAREGAEAPGLEAGREREAAEAACRANPQACLPPGAELGDPSVLLTVGESLAVAGILRSGENIAGQVARLKIPSLAGVIIQAIATLAQPVLNGLAGGLEQCSSDIHITKTEARCQLWVNFVLAIPPIQTGSGICWGKKYIRRGKSHWTFPYCETLYKWP